MSIGHNLSASSGLLVQVWNHEAADRLYCEEIDVGEGEPRAIASGLREHCTLEEMQGRLVLVVCNLRPARLAGFSSNGMVLAAKGADGKVLGTRLWHNIRDAPNAHDKHAHREFS